LILDSSKLDKNLLKLKDFQRKTVDYVFRRMYEDDPPARRFLVADEVGLGKTMVARGLIAKAVHHLQGRVDRIDVIYICSNAAIARQNIARLNVMESNHTSMTTRLTLLPTQVEGLKGNQVNFVSFTPGTTFEMKSSLGMVMERAVLYRMLQGEERLDAKGLLNLLQGNMDRDNWKWWAKKWQADIDEDMNRMLIRNLKKDRKLWNRLDKACDAFRLYKRKLNWEEKSRRNELVGDLRLALAKTCVDALEPELVILDEFQRFKHILDGEDEAAELARALMTYEDVRILLLSATPYKMYALDSEEDDEHYPDFVSTVRFLFDDDERLSRLKDDLRAFRKGIYAVQEDGAESIEDARKRIQGELGSVMVRTERVSSTRDLNAMIAEIATIHGIRKEDLHQALLADSVARSLKAGNVMEYWKSSPYLINLMRDYELKRKFREVQDNPGEGLLIAIERAQEHLLKEKLFDEYHELEPANPRLRALFHDTLDAGLWKLLWMPPSLPYYAPRDAYAEVGDVSKALVFSCWNLVPDAIAALCSYEAERRMLAGFGDLPAYRDLYEKRKPLLRYNLDKQKEPAGMSTLGLLYPSIALAEMVDPLELVLGKGRGGVGYESLRAEASRVIEAELHKRGWRESRSGGLPDQRWYWAAPAMLDSVSAHGEAVRAWMEDEDGWRSLAVRAKKESQEGPTNLVEHIEEVGKAFGGRLQLGRMPDDLAQVLADLALAGPGTCGLRSLGRLTGFNSLASKAGLNAAFRISEGFRTLFNLPESMGLLRGSEEDLTYWRKALQHCVDGNLQAVMDEYVHCLYESLGLLDHEPTDAVTQISEAVNDALSLRTSRLDIDEVRVNRAAGRIDLRPFRLRCRFALRFGEMRDEKDQVINRMTTVREAFNSPFRPFIMATTSIGQEGLDFHTYCHRIYHWNLPSNPVDFEQREGRVHRYKGHAVRKNIAMKYGLESLRKEWLGEGDPWKLLFDLAVKDREEGQNDLIPYWIYELEGGAKVERRVLTLPFSSELSKLRRLKKSLALYRLAFGQPRQEDLMAVLDELCDSPEMQARLMGCQIVLVPEGH